MSAGSIWVRSGIPHMMEGATRNNQVDHWEVPKGAPTMYIYFNNTHATNSIKLSFSAADAAAGLGITVEKRTGYALTAEIREFWTKSADGVSSFELLVTSRG